MNMTVLMTQTQNIVTGLSLIALMEIGKQFEEW